MILGIFSDSDKAGQAVAELKEKGFTDDVSVVTKREGGEAKKEVVKGDNDLVEGATAGAAVGGLTGLLLGAASVAVPGIGTLAVVGPLLAAWGITGAAVGALAGGVTAALVNLGVPEEVASSYASRIERGDVLVTVSAPSERHSDVQQIFAKYNADEVTITRDQQ